MDPGARTRRLRSVRSDRHRVSASGCVSDSVRQNWVAHAFSATNDASCYCTDTGANGGPAANVTIATASNMAGGQAAIGVRLVAVIAAFGARKHHTVTAARRVAVVQTDIGIDLITVIAGFNTTMDMAVAAGRSHTTIETSV